MKLLGFRSGKKKEPIRVVVENREFEITGVRQPVSASVALYSCLALCARDPRGVPVKFLLSVKHDTAWVLKLNLVSTEGGVKVSLTPHPMKGVVAVGGLPGLASLFGSLSLASYTSAPLQGALSLAAKLIKECGFARAALFVGQVFVPMATVAIAASMRVSSPWRGVSGSARLPVVGDEEVSYGSYSIVVDGRKVDAEEVEKGRVSPRGMFSVFIVDRRWATLIQVVSASYMVEMVAGGH